MKKHLYIVAMIALLIGKAGVCYGQDYLRLSERELVGTARYVGMAGAMTAIGGDPSATRDNPAGLGLYRRPEVTLTGAYSFDRTVQAYSSIGPLRSHRLSIPQAALVFTFGNPYATEGVVYNNIMFSYHRLRTFARSYQAQGGPDASLGALMAGVGVNVGIDYPAERENTMQQLLIDELGTVNEFAFDWAINISHRLYVGAGLRLQTYTMSSAASYYEEFATLDAQGMPYSLRNTTSLVFTGVGASLSAGLIYRPIQWCRFGVSIETPSLGMLTTGASGKLAARTDTLRYTTVYQISDFSRNFHLPLRLSLSAASQIGNLAMISLQYDFAHQQDKNAFHTLRAGIEIVPIRGMYINAGYAYEWCQDRTRKQGDPERVVPIDPTFSRQDAYYQRLRGTQYASVGLGYRGHYCIVQAAYQYRWQRINLYAHEKAIPYDMHTDTHRVVLTLGWHRDWP